MNESRQKYSLWIVPEGSVGAKLGTLIDTLAKENDGPQFVPHLTLVADTSANNILSVTERVAKLAQQLKSFTVKLDSYGYLNEEYRSLFLQAHSEELDKIYQTASDVFPQVRTEHFKSMPHLSLLYGLYPEQRKLDIIEKLPVEIYEFTVNSIDIYLTDGPASTWRCEATVPIL